MDASPAWFDLGALFVSIEAERERRAISMAAVAREVGVSASTIRRFADGDDAEADGVLALVRWLGVAPEWFVAGGAVAGELLHPAGDGYVRVDLDLVAEAEGRRGGASGRSRTTVQRLVDAAHRSRRSVASLTRTSAV